MGLLKRPVLLCVIVAVIVILATTLLLRIPREPVVVGFIGGLTGKAADLGVDCRRGAELAINQTNERGGIHGSLIALRVLDDEQDEAQAKLAIDQLLQDALPVIIGPTTSAMTMAVLPQINNSTALLVSPTASTPLLSDQDDNFIRTCTVSTTAATTMARYLRNVADLSRAAVIYDLANKSYTEMWYKAFAKTFLDQGGTAVTPFTFVSDKDLQLLPLVLAMKKQDFDVIVVVANSVDAAMLCQQVRKIDWQIQLALSDWSATEQLLSLGGIAVEDAVISQFFNRNNSNPAFLRFKSDYETAYKSEPGFGALLSYNAATMILKALQDRHPDESLKQAILRISNFTGLQGDFVINRFGDVQHPTYMGLIKNGQFVILEDFR